MGAIFAGLFMAPAISAGFAAIIFMLIKITVHMRRHPVPWAVWTSPFFFLIAGTICTLSIVYKGSPRLGLNKKPPAYIAGVTMGTGAGVAVLAAIFFVPFVHAKIIKRDRSVKWYHLFMGPLLFTRPAVDPSDQAPIPNYAVVQHGDDTVVDETDSEATPKVTPAMGPTTIEAEQDIIEKRDNVGGDVVPSLGHAAVPNPEGRSYDQLVAAGTERFHAKLRRGRGPLGWAMRTLHANRLGPGAIYELHNIRKIFVRLPAQITCGLLYGLHYDIHAAQSGIAGTPEGDRMERVYSYAQKYPNEVEHTYSFVQILTACTASFAHGANDIGNSVGPWAVIFSAWNTGNAAASKAPVPIWQLAVLSATISIGLITYGYNIMKVMGNKITYHSPSRGTSMEMGAAITVLLFSQFSLPVSTSMCITGATVGVGLCNGTLKAVNFQRVGLLVIAWLATIPIAGTLGGVLMGLILNAPHFKSS